MRTWETPEIASISIAETANGGKPSRNFDQQWFDQNGALHVNFVPEPQTTPTPETPEKSHS